jgi:replisome organiser protein
MVNLDDYKPRDLSHGYLWIKFRTSLLDEPKFARMSDLAKAVYLELYLQAGRSDAGGLVLSSDKPASIDDIAYSLHRADADLQTALDELQRAGFVAVQDGQVDICRFASEQGPSPKVEREQWARRQAKKRALAKGEPWTEPDTEPDAEPKPDTDAKTDSKTDKDKDLKTKTTDSEVTQMSRGSHADVTRDNGRSSFDDFSQSVLKLWTAETGLLFKPNQKFLSMVQYWQDEGVTLKHVQTAISESRDKAETPLYLEAVAVNCKNRDPQVIAQKQLEKFRRLSQDNNGGDSGVQ